MSFKQQKFNGLSVQRLNASNVDNALTSLSGFLRESQKGIGRVNYKEVADILAGNKNIVAAQVNDLFEVFENTPDQGVVALLAILDQLMFDDENNKIQLKEFLEKLKTPASYYTNPDTIAREIANAKQALDSNEATVVNVDDLAASLEQAINDNSQMTEGGAEFESCKAQDDGLFESCRPAN